jgi:hypothetical protein
MGGVPVAVGVGVGVEVGQTPSQGVAVGPCVTLTSPFSGVTSMRDPVISVRIALARLRVLQPGATGEKISVASSPVPLGPAGPGGPAGGVVTQATRTPFADSFGGKQLTPRTVLPRKGPFVKLTKATTEESKERVNS